MRTHDGVVAPIAQDSVHGLARILPERAAMAEWQIVIPASRELMLFVKTRETTIGGDIEGILSDNRSAKSDRGCIVDGLGKNITSAEAQSRRHPLSHPNRHRVQDGVGRR